MPYAAPMSAPGYLQYPMPPQPAYQAYPPPMYFASAPLQYGYPKDHPRAGLAFGLGIGALIGGFFSLGIAFGLGPFAWYWGQRAQSEIRRSRGGYHSEGNATAGMVMGIIATVLLVLAVLLWIAVLTNGFGSGTGSDSGGVPA
jgi:hypothetical protein